MKELDNFQFTPLPNNEPSNINKAFDEITGIYGAINREMSNTLTKPDSSWQDTYGQTEDSDARLEVIAKFLGLLQEGG